MKSHTFWLGARLRMVTRLRSGIHQLSGGLLLVLVAGACGASEVKAMRKSEEETWLAKVSREIFLACMYFVVAGFLVPANDPKQATAQLLGAKMLQSAFNLKD